MFGAAIMSHAQWGIVVRSLDTGELLYQLNPDKLMMPASNMKILTLAGAAHVLDWNHRFVTTLETSAAVAGGVLRGDVIVRGGGDPTINSRNGRAASVFAEWATALRSAGIHRIAGRIVGDDQAFDDEGIGGGWAWDYLQFGYAAPVGALQYNEDVATLTVTPGKAAGDPAAVQLAAGAGLKRTQSRGDRSRRRTRDHRIPQASGSSGVGSVRDGPAAITRRRHFDAAHRRSSGRGRQSNCLLRAVAEGRARRG